VKLRRKGSWQYVSNEYLDQLEEHARVCNSAVFLLERMNMRSGTYMAVARAAKELRDTPSDSDRYESRVLVLNHLLGEAETTRYSYDWFKGVHDSLKEAAIRYEYRFTS
jgi:hypothetical protein